MSRKNSLIDPLTIKVSGPGLSSGRVGEECKFHVDGTDGGLALSFHIEGPSKPIIETCAGKGMSLDISYIPLLPGEYKLSLLWYGKHIDESPYILNIEGDGPAPTIEEIVKEVRIRGKGLDCAKVDEYNEILVDCRRAFLKDHRLRCSIKSPSRSSAMVKLQDNMDGTYSMYYKPTFPGQYSVNITVDEIHVPGSPFVVLVKS